MFSIIFQKQKNRFAELGRSLRTGWPAPRNEEKAQCSLVKFKWNLWQEEAPKKGDPLNTWWAVEEGYVGWVLKRPVPETLEAKNGKSKRPRWTRLDDVERRFVAGFLHWDLRLYHMVRKVEAFFDKRKMNSHSLMCWIRYHLIFKQQYKAWKNCSIVLCIQESDPLTVWSSTSTTATIEAKFDQQREGQGIHGYYRLIFSEWNKSDIEALHFATFTCSRVRNLWSAQPHGMSWWRFCDW